MIRRRTVLSGGIAMGLMASLPVMRSVRAQVQTFEARFCYRYSISAAPGIVAGRAVDWPKYGLDLQISRVPSGTIVRDQIVSGSMDFGTLTIVPFVTGAAAGSMVAIGVESFAGDTICIMAKSGSGIQSVADLKGRTVASKTGTGTDNAFRKKLLPSVGLTEDDLTIVNVQFNDQLAAVAAGSVDAMVGLEPFCTLGEGQGILDRLTDMSDVDPVPVLLVASTEIVNKDPEAVVRFLRGWLAGVDIFKNEPAKVAEVLQEEFKADRQENVTAEMLEKIVQRMTVEPELTPSIQDEMKAFAVELQKAGRLPNQPDWEKAIRTDFMASAKQA